MPWQDRNNPEKFAGFAHICPALLNSGPFATGSPTVFGISENYGNLAQREDFFSQQVIRPGVSPGQENTLPSYFEEVVPLLYPSVKFEVVGIAGDFLNNSLGANGTRMRSPNPTIACK